MTPEHRRPPAAAVAAAPRAHLLAPVPIAAVTIDDRFWAPRRRTWHEVTIPDCLDKFEAEGAFANFDRVRDGLTGGHAGQPWYDGLVYETIRGAADFLAARRDGALEARLDGYIRRIAAAAATDPSGYLNTYTQLSCPEQRWGLNGGLLRWQHDVYNAGCLVEAGVHYYLATSRDELLRVAVRFADHMCDLMGPPPRRNIVPAHSLPEEALVRLYLLLRDRPGLKHALLAGGDEGRYLRLAEFWIEHRGVHTGRPDWEREGNRKSEEYIRSQGYGSGRPSWGSYAQDHTPVLEQDSIEGHAVRATLLCAGLAAAGAANGREDYLGAVRRLWENLVARRLYLTGGVGAQAAGERFGRDFDLPNSGYLETCAAAGAAFFHHNMHLAFADARYADELERVLFNGALAGISLRGDAYYYQNPLEASAERSRWPWHACPCCPPMLLKLMGALPGYVYARDADSVYVGLYVGSRAELTVSETRLVVRQTTDYPWSGDVTLALAPASPTRFALRLRVPGWAERAAFTVNGAPADPDEIVRGYATFRRSWREGDTVGVALPMPPRLLEANPRVGADAGRVAVTRGPLVYCLESVDNETPLPLLGIDPGAPLEAAFAPVLLGGVALVRGPARALVDWGDALYRPAASGIASQAAAFVAIPYFANSNRQPAEMMTWVRALRPPQSGTGAATR